MHYIATINMPGNRCLPSLHRYWNVGERKRGHVHITQVPSNFHQKLNLHVFHHDANTIVCTIHISYQPPSPPSQRLLPH